MKKNIAKYLLFIYRNYIGDCEEELFNSTTLFFLKPAYYTRMILIYIFSIIFFPILFIHFKYEKEIELTIEETREMLDDFLYNK